jgi:FtsP/CotA-like multicopper oxidase with cupredoxin domain
MTNVARGPDERVLRLAFSRAWDTGVKDTVTACAGQVTRIRATFGRERRFVWHCHVVEHEDNQMMRPYRSGPPQPGVPRP